MPILSKPSKAAHMAVVYITIGALMSVWAAVYYCYLGQQEVSASHTGYFWCYGFFFTGLALLIIGVTIGQIGRNARVAELPPDAPANPTAEPAVVAPAAANAQPGVARVASVPAVGAVAQAPVKAAAPSPPMVR